MEKTKYRLIEKIIKEDNEEFIWALENLIFYKDYAYFVSLWKDSVDSSIIEDLKEYFNEMEQE